jgi:hypothetical protein
MHELFYPIIVPAVAGIIPILIPRRGKMVAGIISFAVMAWMFVRALSLFGRWELTYGVRLFTIAGSFPVDLTLRLYHFSSFILPRVSEGQRHVERLLYIYIVDRRGGGRRGHDG